MPKLIVTSRYLKSGSKKNLSNYVKYIATREGSVPVTVGTNNSAASKSQEELIKQMLIDYPDSKELFEYEDYINDPTAKNASKLISEIIDRNMDRMTNRENYVGYLANRPGVVKLGSHGLFGGEDKPIDLNAVAKEIAEHKGNVWTHVVSLRRDNAQQMGYDNLSAWRELVKRQMPNIAKQSKIDMKNLKWYAAFHDKKTNPHVHIVVYSTNPKEGFLTNNGIEKIRSGFANDIYHDELYNLYGRQTNMRDHIKKESAELMQKLAQEMSSGETVNEELVRSIATLKSQLDNSKGKKVYGYLKPEIKKTVDDIFFQLAHNEKIQKMYKLWCEMEQQKHDVYSSAKVTFPQLVDNQHFKSVKNMIIKTVLEMGEPITENFELPAPKPQENDNDELSIDYGDELQPDDFIFELDNAVEKDVSDFSSSNKYTLSWSSDYKAACKILYSKDSTQEDYINAEKLLLGETENNNILAIYELGKFYSTEKFKCIDIDKSNRYFENALNGLLNLESSFPHAINLNIHKFNNSLKNKKAENMRAYIQYRIGKMYCYGLGTAQDYIEAFKWFEQAATEGNKFAQFSLANMYYYGNGTDRSYEKAINWYMAAADQGQPYADYAIAQMYANGESVDKDEVQAQSYYKQALVGFLKLEADDQADDNLLYKLGRMFKQGLGTNIDIPKAIDYFKQSAELGNKNAKRTMAMEYISGENVEQEIEKGMEVLAELADNGDSLAAYRLGKLYLFGNYGIKKDRDNAIKLLTISAEGGNEYAEMLLQNIDDYEKTVMTNTVFSLFAHLSHIIEEDYMRSHRKLQSKVDKKLRQMIERKKEELGIRTDGNIHYDY